MGFVRFDVGREICFRSGLGPVTLDTSFRRIQSNSRDAGLAGLRRGCRFE